MDINKIINWRELSRLLAGNGTSIRSNNVACRYTDDVEQLKKVVVEWYDARKEKADIQSLPNDLKGLADRITKQRNIVSQNDIKSAFFKLVEKQKNIYYNGLCYRYSNVVDQMKYFYTLEEAVSYRDSLI